MGDECVADGRQKRPINGQEASPPLIRAAEYVRMSTEHQQYSTENQSDAIRDYAVLRGMEIVRTYADHGKSGMSIVGRDALKRLLADVASGKADYTVILVYDVSRWGRFQDSDRQGGPAGYGLRRQLIDHTGARKTTLVRGEQKSIQTDRVILVPGPDDEIATVRGIYCAFVESGWSESRIADDLNARGLRTDLAHAWSRATIHEILVNEKYCGNNVWNRTSSKLVDPLTRNPPELFIRRDQAFAPIVDREMFAAARSVFEERAPTD